MAKTAKPDPVIAELHAVRDERAARLGHDIGAIFEDIRATQKSLGRECVRLPARRIVAEQGDSPLRRRGRAAS